MGQPGVNLGSTRGQHGVKLHHPTKRRGPLAWGGSPAVPPKARDILLTTSSDAIHLTKRGSKTWRKK